MHVTMLLSDVNQMNYKEFLGRFGNIVEAAPWLTSALWSFRPFTSSAEIHRRVCSILDHLQLEVKEGLLRGHPDLAGTEARENSLGWECTHEQGGAGLLHGMTETKRRAINDLNARYKTKFSFPFVVCVRETRDVKSILKAFNSRIKNGREGEVENGISEIKKICWYRLRDAVQTTSNKSKL